MLLSFWLYSPVSLSSAFLRDMKKYPFLLIVNLSAFSFVEQLLLILGRKFLLCHLCAPFSILWGVGADLTLPDFPLHIDTCMLLVIPGSCLCKTFNYTEVTG